jgi:hypothetical protein
VGSCEHGNELSGSIKGSEFVNLLGGYQLVMKDCGNVVTRSYYKTFALPPH